MQARIVRLPDGRSLAYDEYGDPGGTPVLNCHGGLTCRRDIEGCDRDAREAGVRVISPDRPGIGSSERRAGRELLDWPVEVAALLDTLGVDRFAVIGWSAGGAYAAACAQALPRRVTALALLASVIPPDWAAMTSEINRLDRLLLRRSNGALRTNRLVLGAMGALARSAPASFRRLSMASLDAPSRRLLGAAFAGSFSGPIAEGLRDPDGVLDDYRVLGSPWGFDLADLGGPVYIWQGDGDTMVPPAWASRLAERIPGAELRIFPDQGHFLPLAIYPEIFAALLHAGGQDAPVEN
jgi:pimeloyl-ACP methyl ester carboxylesterase